MARISEAQPLSPEKQEVMRNLATSLGGGVGRLHLLDLQPARDHFSGDWPRLSARVHSIVQGAMRKTLGEGDSFVAIDELSYAIINGPASAAGILDILERISDEVTRRIMGENSRKLFVTISQASGDEAPEVKKSCDAVSNIERILGDMVNTEDEFSFGDIEYVYRQMIGHDTNPINILVPVPIFSVTANVWRSGYDCLPPEPDTALIAELDALTAEAAAKQMATMDRQGLQGLLQVPVHKATLSSRKYRELYLKICRGLFGRHKGKLVFDIFGIEDGTPSNRVIEHMQWMRPYCRAIAATVDVDFSTLNSFSGAGVMSLGTTMDTVDPAATESKLARFMARLKSTDSRSHVHGLRTLPQLALCRSLSVSAMNGSVIDGGGDRHLALVHSS